AVVRLRCNNTKYELVEQTRTDKNGYFLFMPLKLTTMAFHKCRVHLVSSPMGNCSVPTNFHGGVSGAALVPSPTPPAKPVPVQFFNVGPFAFEPHKILPCRHY
ncbi:Pollen Ole e 1 allergen and extensin family protein, partial [Striga hermonthica]